MPTFPENGTYPYETLIRHTPTVGISHRTLTVFEGRQIVGDPVPVEIVDDPLMQELAMAFASAAVTERDAAIQQVQELTVERNTLASEKEGMLDRIAELEATIKKLTASKAVLTVSPAQARRALMQWGLLEAVETLVSYASADVQIKWEYATEFRRDDADLLALFQMLEGVVMPNDLDSLFALADTL